MARPPFNRQTPIGRGNPVLISMEFSRWLDSLAIAGGGDSDDINALEARMTAAESAITGLQSVDVALAGSIMTNTNNIAALIFDVAALQASVSGLLAEQFTPVAVASETMDWEPV